MLQEWIWTRKRDRNASLHGNIAPLQPETTSSQPGSFIYKARSLRWFDNKLHLCVVEGSESQMQLTIRKQQHNILKSLEKLPPQSNSKVAKNHEKNQAFMLQLIGADVGQVSWWQTQNRWVEFRKLRRFMPIQGKPCIGSNINLYISSTLTLMAAKQSVIRKWVK